ncbi:MAG: putative membrane protein YphA (DoxX/SURF4 family) [Halioglobus sp.]|jgi:uncharacterized membrane protein YphA (DoxX/SURF4 family)
MFVFSGIKKILFLGDTIQYMAANNVPKPEFFIFLAIVIEIIGGLFILLGYRSSLGAGLLMVFLIPVTLYFHNFWSYDGAAGTIRMQLFMKNLAIFGGLLYVFTHGPGLLNLEDELKRRQEQGGPPGGGPMGPGGPQMGPGGPQMGPGGPQMGPGGPQMGPGGPQMGPGGPQMGPGGPQMGPGGPQTGPPTGASPTGPGGSQTGPPDGPLQIGPPGGL